MTRFHRYLRRCLHRCLRRYLHRYQGAVLGLAICGCDVTELATSRTAQAGETMQGETMQGESLQGMAMRGMRRAGATLAGAPLTGVRVEGGELVAERGTTTLRGAALVGVQLQAEVAAPGAAASAITVARYRITAIAPEDAGYDPTGTGNTFLYSLEQWVADRDAWQAACPADADGRRVAIPLDAIWNDHGDRVESATLFTFGCTFGVIAKCYRWGYRPWVTGYGDLAAMHTTCTRLARADYCGTGTPHTRDGTLINVWDELAAPGPIQHHGVLPPLGMVFEAGWNPSGAVCLSRARWLQDDAAVLATLCPDRLVPPGLGETVCNVVSDVLDYDATARMFNESYLNVSLDRPGTSP